MPSVLFVCTANRFRSPLSAAFFSRRLQQEGLSGWEIGSAGTWADPGLPVVPSPQWAAQNFGVSLQDHRSRRVEGTLLASYDLILVMERSHFESIQVEFPETRSRLFMLAQICTGMGYDIPDPAIQQGESFLEIGRELSDLINKGFPRIFQQASQGASSPS